MGETNMRWFRWVADHAQSFFWAVCGGICAFGAVFFGAVASAVDALPLYLAVLVAMMGAAGGLAVIRRIGIVNDRRATRRKTTSTAKPHSKL
jgi:choline-glycine betaine transporter